MGGVVGGALSGASAGAAFGTPGAIIGGGIGLASGLMGSAGDQAQQNSILGAGKLQAGFAARAGQVYNQYANMGNTVQGEMYAQGVNNLRQGQNQALGALAPYNTAGLNALDEYQKSLGMSTISSQYGGSLGLQNALEQQQSVQNWNQIQSLNNIAVNWKLPGATTGDIGHDITSAATQLMNRDPATLSPDQLAFVQQYRAMGGQDQMTGQAFLAPFQQNGQAPTLDPNQQALLNAYNSGNMSSVSSPTNANDVINQFENANPQYQFALQQGLQAVQNQASAQGLMGSAPMAKELQSYATGLASQTYNNWQGQLASLAGQGYQANGSGIYQSTANNLANLGTNYGAAVNQNFTGMGSNMGNSLLAQGAALGNSQISAANVGALQNSSNSSLLGSLGANPSLFSNLKNAFNSSGTSNMDSTNNFSIPQPQFDMGFMQGA